jgi:hypothetical protein
MQEIQTLKGLYGTSRERMLQTLKILFLLDLIKIPIDMNLQKLILAFETQHLVVIH